MRVRTNRCPLFLIFHIGAHCPDTEFRALCCELPSNYRKWGSQDFLIEKIDGINNFDYHLDNPTVTSTSNPCTEGVPISVTLSSKCSPDGDNGKYVDFSLVTEGEITGHLEQTSVITNENGIAETKLIIDEGSSGTFIISASNPLVEDDSSPLEIVVRIQNCEVITCDYELQVVSGNGQTVCPGEALEEPIVYLLKDEEGQPSIGSSIDITISLDGVTQTVETIGTDSEGKVFYSPILGEIEGDYKIKAEYTCENGTKVKADANAVVSSEGCEECNYELQVVSGNGQTVCPGEALEEPIVYLLKDEEGQPSVGSSIDVTISLNGVVQIIETIETDSEGKAFYSPILGEIEGEYIIKAEYTCENNAKVKADASAVVSSEGCDECNYKISIISNIPLEICPGDQLEEPIEIELLDENGEPAYNEEIVITTSFKAEGLNEQFDNPITETTDENGKVFFNYALGDNPGIYTLKAEYFCSASQPPVTRLDSKIKNLTNFVYVSISINSAQANCIPEYKLEKISGDNQNGYCTEKLEEPIVVKLTDKSDIPIEGKDILFQVCDPNGDQVLYLTNTDDNGLASIDLELGNEEGEYHIYALYEEEGLQVEFIATAFEKIIIAVECDKYEIYPTIPKDNPNNRNKLNIKVVVKNHKGQIKKDYSLDFYSERLYTPGGHLHGGTIPTNYKWKFIDNNTESVTFTGITDKNGEITLKYKSSQFGGIENITVESSLDENFKSSSLITVKVPNLIKLSKNDLFYILTGSTSSHPDNHYGTLSTNVNLILLAGYFHKSILKDCKLRYNDMSLEFGGLFDISSKWIPPHHEHREGKNCDISYYYIDQNGQIKKISITQKILILSYLELKGIDYVDESATTHIHIRNPN